MLSVLDHGWILDVPGLSGADLAIDEIPAAGEITEPPAAAIDLLQAYVRTAQLVPVGRMRRVRQAVQVGGDNGAGVRVLSDEVSVLDGRRVAIRYRELVLDAGHDADTALVHGVIARLRAAGAGGPDRVPEFARVLGPASLDPPEIVVTPPGPKSTVGEAVAAALAASVVRLMRHDAGVRIGGEPEAVHQARVATRRMRSDMGTFSTLLESEPTVRLREELRWLAELLGQVRDTDVLIERMTGRLNEIPGPAAGQRALLQRLSERRQAARKRMLEGLRSERYAVLLDDLVATANHPPLRRDPDVPAARVLPTLVAQPWKKLVRLVGRLGDNPSDDQLHAVRIASKRARYASEAVAAVAGKLAHRFAEAVAELQSSLGDYNDTVVARQWLAEVSSGLGAGSAFYAGVLTERERLLGEEALDNWRGAWKKLDRKKLHGWLDG